MARNPPPATPHSCSLTTAGASFKNGYFHDPYPPQSTYKIHVAHQKSSQANREPSVRRLKKKFAFKKTRIKMALLVNTTAPRSS